MSIRARRALVSNARSFFDRHLGGIFAWDSITMHKGEKLPALRNGRRNPLGTYREHIKVTFGGFDLEVSSPEDNPPLGWSLCRHTASGEICEGVSDPETWDKMAKFIKRNIGHG